MRAASWRSSASRLCGRRSTPPCAHDFPRAVAGAHERGLLVDADEHRVARRAGRPTVRAGGRRRVPWYGKIASPGTSPSPTVYAPPRGSTIGSPSTVAPAPDAAMHRAAPVRVDHRVVERAALQHRAQVQRRAVGDVDELARPAPPRRSRRPRRRAGSAPARPVDRRAEPLEVGGGPLDRPLGMLERGRGRQHAGPRRSRPARAAGRRTPCTARSTRRRRRGRRFRLQLWSRRPILRAPYEATVDRTRRPRPTRR